MKKETFNNKEAAELQKLMTEKREAMRGLAFGASGSKNKNVKAGRNLRRDVARLLTALNQRASK